MATAQGSLGVSECTTNNNNHLCPDGYCVNSGVCVIEDLLPECLCPLGFAGARCDQGTCVIHLEI